MHFYRNRYLYGIVYLIAVSLRKIFNTIAISNYLDRLIYDRMKFVYLRKGLKIGDSTMLYSVKVSSSTKGDKFFVGDNCILTGCTLLGHDASPALYISELNNKKDVYRSGARSSYRMPIIIGDNVFVGVGSIILPGITIGDDVIVAAGSIVTKNIDSGNVVAGNPAKVIKRTEEVIKKYRDLLITHPERF
jgi:acetyltransferase-like isoleucine patch superfamily enzyme